jgi:hypothetical protein
VPPEIEDEVYDYLFDYYDRNIRNNIKKWW